MTLLFMLLLKSSLMLTLVVTIYLVIYFFLVQCINIIVIVQGYVDFGRFDNFNHFEAGSGEIDFIQVSPNKA